MRIIWIAIYGVSMIVAGFFIGSQHEIALNRNRIITAQASLAKLGAQMQSQTEKLAQKVEASKVIENERIKAINLSSRRAKQVAELTRRLQSVIRQQRASAKVGTPQSTDLGNFIVVDTHFIDRVWQQSRDAKLPKINTTGAVRSSVY